MFVVGVILLIVAGVLGYLSQSAKNKLLEMAGAETFTAASLKETADAVAKEIGAGSFRQKGEVKGVVRTEKPLVSELKQISCVYYESSVREEYEEVYYERDSQGREQRRTRTHTKELRDNRAGVPFYVEDATGRILVRPDGAEWDPETVVNEFQPGGIPQLGMMLNSNTRFVGTRYREVVVPLGKRVYVLGEATDAGGLGITKPEKEGKFLISLKSEEQLSSEAKSASSGYRIGALLCALVGLGLMVADLVS